MTPFRQAVKTFLGKVLPAERFLLRGDPSCVAVTTTSNGPDAVPISLTFDDGPHPEWTPLVLDALDEADWIGTFFLVGRKAEAYPNLVREIVQRGHQIGNHSYAHREPDEIGVREFNEGVIRTQQLLSELAGRHVSLMRPPKGRLDIRKTSALWRSGQSVVLWNIDPRDYRMSSAEGATNWAKDYVPAAGDIVLLHDRLPYAGEIVRTLANRQSDKIRSVGVSHWLGTSPRGGLKSALRSLSNLVIS